MSFEVDHQNFVQVNSNLDQLGVIDYISVVDEALNAVVEMMVIVSVEEHMVMVIVLDDGVD
jgi:hypothetical protein